MIFPASNNLFSKYRHEIWIYSLLIIASASAALLSVKNINLSPDSINYALVSQQINAGNGIKVPMIWLDSNAVPVNGTVPMLWQPPLYPILLAIFGGVTPQSFLAAQLLNVICHVFISVFTFLFTKKLYDNASIALLTGILVSVSLPMLSVTHHMLSEPLFTAFAIAAIYFLILSRNSNSHHYSRYFFIASICASAAILTRYAGIPLIAIFFLEAIKAIKNKRPGFKFRSIILATIIPLITPLILFVRNYFVSGTIRGVIFSQPVPDRPYLSTITGTIKMLFSQFQLGNRSIIFIMIFIMFLVLYIFINNAARRELSKFFRSGLDLIILFIIFYTALIYFIMARESPIFDLRFVSPLVPFLLIISILIIVFLGKMIQSKGFFKLSLAWVLLSLGIITYGNFYKTYLNFNELLDKQESFYSILYSSTYNWVTENYNKNIIIATNEPYRLSFFGGYSTVRLPHRKFYTNAPIPEDMEVILPKRMSEIGAKALVLFNEAKEENYGNYIARLFNKREDYAKFSVAHECSDGVVYNLRK